jgi:flagellar hook-associated protein FlgK
VSTFSGLNAATTALWANRRGLDVTGQNIANVNTEGYSRQRVDQKAISASAVPAFFSTSSGIGQGVNADDVIRIRDAFLEGRGHTEHANNAQLVAEVDALELVEQAFREPGDTGLQKMLSEVWSSFQDVANKPDDLAARGQVIKRLETLVGGLHFSQAQLDGQWNQTRENVAVLVDDVNAAAENIATLNVAIRRATQSGLPSNDLADQRDLLIMKLADQVGATVRPGEDGVLNVVVGGLGLVSGGTTTKLALAGTDDPASLDPDSVPPKGEPVNIVAEPGDFQVRVAGTAAGQLTALNRIIPSHSRKLDGIAGALVTKLNTQHIAGFDLGGVAGTPVLSPASGVTASSITVSINDPRRIAASGVSGAGNLDRTNADAIALLGDQVGGIDAGYRAMIVELGVQSAVSQRNLGIQTSITTTVDAARDSVAGVNLDEELTNMLSYQHAYSAAGRMITAIDEALDVLINRTGVVGR